MSDDMDKIKTLLAKQDEKWWWNLRNEADHESSACVSAILESIGLTVSDDAGVLAKAREFKAYVHKRLDDAGIPTHPDGPHSKEGCRIGDRLDIALAARADLLAKIAVVRAELVKLRDKEAWRDQQSAVDHRGITVRAFNKALEVYDAAFPSDPGEVKVTDAFPASEPAAEDVKYER